MLSHQGIIYIVEYHNLAYIHYLAFAFLSIMAATLFAHNYPAAKVDKKITPI